MAWYYGCFVTPLLCCVHLPKPPLWLNSMESLLCTCIWAQEHGWRKHPQLAARSCFAFKSTNILTASALPSDPTTVPSHSAAPQMPCCPFSFFLQLPCPSPAWLSADVIFLFTEETDHQNAPFPPVNFPTFSIDAALLCSLCSCKLQIIPVPVQCQALHLCPGLCSHQLKD